ncbi:pirin family protein [Marivirga sp. S37H4]|uniref:Pirin family protein n=1 Tax=Marivirga aurantiaca TaxID=2802615 RepID=A0A934X1S9_9BACT|nr:pirin family protein [Marivirga aurantiaca]MBK6267109.1 pirin family protein [Marivirga aurantiaca]
MKKTIYKADTRGHANHGWLESYHTFSFASYYDQERVHFGALRVLNDDKVDAGMGFGKHPHDNMEIISIPLFGDLAHQDSMGNNSVIKENDVQVMSAGTGIVHSEFNPNKDKKTAFLQIWLFPNKQNVEPRYGQKSFSSLERKNNFQMIVSPNPEELNTWIHQDAWFYLADLDKGFSKEYTLQKEGNGLFLFLLSGSLEVAGEKLNTRDAIGLTELESIEVKANEASKLLLMEVPMEW